MLEHGRNHEVGFRLVGCYVLKDGKQLGSEPLTSITTAVVNALYEKLLVVRETDAAGNVIERERRTTVNHAMKSCRRAWNVVQRRNQASAAGQSVRADGARRLGPRDADREVCQVANLPHQCDQMGLPSLATAALIGWEWLQRQTDIFTTFDVTHYRPKHLPNAVHVLHEKTGEENWILLLDPETDAPLYPELMAELDAVKRERIGGLMLRRDWGHRSPWPTWPKPGEVDLTHMSRKVKEVIVPPACATN
jgi:hypothetical protein